jgi:glucose/arabinose dehydrogenase
MRTLFTRRQIETALAGVLAAITAAIGLAGHGEQRLGPKFLTLKRIGRFKEPVFLSQPPGSANLLYIVEKAGKVVVLKDGDEQKRPFLDLRGKVKDDGEGGEQGLLSIAFSPDYQESGLSYVAYTDHRNALRIVEYRHRPGDELRADKATGRLVLRIPEPTTKHHGGLLLFGPDEYLYVGSGDGGPSGDPGNVAQNRRLLLGKLLRIDPGTRAVASEEPKPAPKPKRGANQGKARKQGGSRGKLRKRTAPAAYTVPRDNPFVGRPGRDEIFAYGLRNPWRFSFDRATGNLTIGDVGDGRFEEVDILPRLKARGANFGWSAFEGNYRLKPGIVSRDRTVSPVLAYPHGPGCAVIGGYVARDPRLSRIAGREVTGRYIFGDYCTGRLFAFRFTPTGRGKERSFRFRVPNLTSFAEDRDGRIYVLQQVGPVRDGIHTPGAVYRLDPARKEVGD